MKKKKNGEKIQQAWRDGGAAKEKEKERIMPNYGGDMIPSASYRPRGQARGKWARSTALGQEGREEIETPKKRKKKKRIRSNHAKKTR